jgi:holo-[acyl-carrier protein] synthase
VIIGIGTDLVKIERIAASIERWGDRFVHKILAESEMLVYQQNPSAAFVAKRFAAKEAMAKALATGMSCGVHFVQIAVVGKPGHAPQISLSGAAAARAATLGVEQMHLSISDEAEFALAFVVLSN